LYIDEQQEVYAVAKSAVGIGLAKMSGARLEVIDENREPESRYGGTSPSTGRPAAAA